LLIPYKKTRYRLQENQFSANFANPRVTIAEKAMRSVGRLKLRGIKIRWLSYFREALFSSLFS